MASSVFRFLCVAFLVTCNVATAQPADPAMQGLDAYMASAKDWQSTPSDLAYIGARCSALFAIVSGYLESSGEKSSKAMAAQLDKASVVFDQASVQMSTRAGMNSDTITARYKMILDTYQATLRSNKLLHNNALLGIVGNDTTICTRSISHFTKVAQAIN